MNEIIHIAFGFDKNYAMPCGVAILSVCKTTPGPICFHALIAEDVTEDIRNRMEGMVLHYGNSIVFHVVDPSSFCGMSEFMYFSRSVYNRLFIPEILPSDVDKVLYLDSDIIAVASLRSMWEIELGEDVPAAMAYDSGCSNVKFHNRTGIPLSRPYFNSGVIMMNLPCWRKEDICHQIVRDINEHHYTLVDQDALNVVIGPRVKALHLKYNLQVTLIKGTEEDWILEKDKYFDLVYEAKAEPVIIHYIEGLKPWHEGCPYAEEWLQVKSLSPWKDAPLSRYVARGGFAISLEGIPEIDVMDAESVSQPLLALALRFAKKHPRAFSLFKRMLWSAAERKHLLEK